MNKYNEDIVKINELGIVISWQALQQIGITSSTSTIQCHVVIDGTRCTTLLQNHNPYSRCINCKQTDEI